MTKLSLPEEDLQFEIARLEMRPGDVLAVRPVRPIPSEAAARLQAYLKRSLPDVRVLVLDPGMELQVVSKAEAKRLGSQGAPQQ